MKVLSNEMRQVFRAYTRQLREKPTEKSEGLNSLRQRKGFEQVELSNEALERAADADQTDTEKAEL